MTKWFEEVANDASNIVSSRVRLSRNWEEYKFPSRLEPDEARTMIARLKQNFRDLGDRDGQFYEYEDLELMEKLDRTALRERRKRWRKSQRKPCRGRTHAITQRTKWRWSVQGISLWARCGGWQSVLRDGKRLHACIFRQRMQRLRRNIARVK